MALFKQAERRVFHTNNGVWVERLPTDEVRIFRATTGTSTYYTQEKGFHAPEEDLAKFDANTWDSIVKFCAPSGKSKGIGK